MQTSYGPRQFSAVLLLILLYLAYDFDSVRKRMQRDQIDPGIRRATKMIAILVPFWAMVFILLFLNSEDIQA